LFFEIFLLLLVLLIFVVLVLFVLTFSVLPVLPLVVYTVLEFTYLFYEFLIAVSSIVQVDVVEDELVLFRDLLSGEVFLLHLLTSGLLVSEGDVLVVVDHDFELVVPVFVDGVGEVEWVLLVE